MNPDLINKLAEAIAREHFLYNWKFYVIACILFFIFGVAGNLTASYFKKRGETLATKADMSEILGQISATTRAAEEVRLAISHEDWVTREWRTIRRLKLEELLSAAYSLNKWLTIQRNTWLNSESIEMEGAPMDRIKLISKLYFPEIDLEVNEIWSSYQKAYVFIMEISNRLRVANDTANVDAQQAALKEFSDKWISYYLPTQESVKILENKASNLMMKINNT